MKKFLLLILCVLTLVSCDKKKNEELNVEQITEANKQDMASKHDTFTWYETCIRLKDFMDEECDGTIENISNIFQVVEDIDSISSNVFVIVYSTDIEGTIIDVEEGFWVEDFSIDSVKVSFKEAFELINKVNYPKPHSRYVTLRKQIGPKPCNAQWIFGNVKYQLYVDAVTGDVTDENPAF